MDIRDRNVALAQIGRVGKAGGLALGNNPKKSIDDLQRRCGELESALSRLIEHAFRGPLHSSARNTFTIDARTAVVGYNLLTAAQAVKEGLPSATGFAIFRHGLGYVLDRYDVTSYALNTTPLGVQPARLGGFRIYSVSDVRTVFQVSTEDVTQQALIELSCYSSRQIPLGSINPRETGASRGSTGEIAVQNLGTTT